jgi:GT2 family glycosyltransferase
MTFNIFHYSGNSKLLAKALSGITYNKTIWLPDPVVQLSWVQQFRRMAAIAREREESWFGYAHDDGEISVEDFQKLLDASKTIDIDKVFAIMTCKSDDPNMNTDVYALFNTKLYWDIGGHDENFTLYYADADFFNRAQAKGYEQTAVETPSLKHIQSYGNKQASGLDKIARDLHFIKDRAYFFNKHPDHVAL